MAEYKCTWCNQEVREQDFDIHSRQHYAEQIRLKYYNPSTVVSSVATVSYVRGLQ